MTAAVTFALIGVGGMVTSRGAGLAVPDWPNSFGYNMFLFPVSKWIGGIFYEHTHRLVATFLGVLVVALTRWLGGKRSQLPLAIIGLAELLAGFLVLKLAPDLQGAGHFLSGIGGVVLLAAVAWGAYVCTVAAARTLLSAATRDRLAISSVCTPSFHPTLLRKGMSRLWHVIAVSRRALVCVRNEPAPGILPMLGWLAFAGVQIQGLLGGLRVVLFKDEIGVFHATLAQMFFVLMCAILLLSSRWWQGKVASGEWRGAKGQATGVGLTWLLAGTTALILGQLILGAMMRHQHAGLAIPDFPLAYGKIWPAMDPGSVELYNQRRLEVVAVKPITAFQIGLQMTHRITALLILGAVAACAWLSPRTLGATQPLGKWSLAWLALVLAQAALGAATVLTDKAADVATGHVLLGALSLAAGSLLSIVVWKETIVLRNEVKLSEPVFGGEPSVAAGLRRMHAAR